MRRLALLVGLLVASSALADQKANSVWNPSVAQQVATTTLTSQPSGGTIVTDAGNVGYTPFQEGIPFILGSSCNITAVTGTITSCATLPNSTNPYTAFPLVGLMNFPAATVGGAGTLGGAAGWYFVKLSSATAMQICTEGADAAGAHAGYQLASGSPVVPATCTAPTAAVTGVFAGFTAGTQVVGPGFSLPGNSLGPNGRLECTGTMVEDTSANVKTLKFRLNQAQIGATAVPTTATDSFLSVLIQNEGNAKSQSTTVIFPTSATATALQISSSVSETAVDMTVAEQVDATLTIATGGTSAVLKSFGCKAYSN